jgi:hypothetical protein
VTIIGQVGLADIYATAGLVANGKITLFDCKTSVDRPLCDRSRHSLF